MADFLVTGAAGFVGSALAQSLLDDGHGVWTIDNLSTGKEENIPSGVHVLKGDCQDPKVVKLLEGRDFKAIIHLAGQSSGEVSFDDPVYDLRTNTEATLCLIDYGLRNNCDRFIFASSMSVYGDVNDGPVDEHHACYPLSFYGVGKLASEHYLRIYQNRGLKPTVLRYFNIYGPNQNLENLRQGMVSIYLAQLILNQEVVVKGSKHRFRDFIYIDDITAFTKHIIDREDAHGAVINVGTGRKTTVEELINKLLHISKIEKSIMYQDGTPGDQQGIYADISLLQNKFGFNPEISLDAGLARMIDWAKIKI
jgi:UDP-glucose 4-epimerase